MKFLTRASKYLFAILMVSVLFQSVAIIVIHYSEAAEGSGRSTIAARFDHEHLAGAQPGGRREAGAGGLLRAAGDRMADRIREESYVVRSETARFRGDADSPMADRIRRSAERRIEDVLRGAIARGGATEPLPGSGAAPPRHRSAAVAAAVADIDAVIRGTAASPLLAAGARLQDPAAAPPDLLRPQATVEGSPAPGASLPEIPAGVFRVPSPSPFPSPNSDPLTRGRLLASIDASSDATGVVISRRVREPLAQPAPEEPPRPRRVVEAPGVRAVASATFAPTRDEAPAPDAGATRDRPSRRIAEPRRAENGERSDDVGRVVRKSTAESSSGFIWPLRGEITSPYGMRIHPVSRRWDMHTGMDIGGSTGDPIRAAADGTVTFVGWMGGYGKIVVIRHARGYETRYAHCSKILVRKGDRVSAGSTIAKVGSTGTSTGPHLHLELLRNGRTLNPATRLR